MSSLLSVHDLTIAYGKNKVIDSATFDIKSGDFICLVGANGSGKTTLVKTLLGLISPTSGKIHFGDNLTQTSIGYLPQEMHFDQNFPATVSEIVLSGALGRLGRHICYRSSDQKAAADILHDLHIQHLVDTSFAKLSGGEKQKVLLARALMATSSLLILDEPSNNLDHKSREDFYRTLQDLHNSGLTIIMITHDLDRESFIANKVIAIKNSHVTSSSLKTYLRSHQ